MKIVCDNCQAKYSIADEKVAGKVFKIRCKRCSNVIVVQGAQDAPAEAAPAEQAAAPTDAIWHVVVNGEQHGPYDPGQLAEMLSVGTIDWEAFVWAEGFDNWVAMSEVPDLVNQISGGGAAQPAQDAAPAMGADPFAQPSMGADPFAQPSMGADPFAQSSIEAAQPALASPASGDDRPDLFASSPRGASPFDGGGGGGGVVASAPRPDSSAAMTGARNENSVLFSLSNLQSLATGQSNPPASAPAPSAGHAAGEGSGLIDIRALAATTGVGAGGDAAGEKDDLLAIGSQQGAFGALGSPMLAPAADDSGGSKKTLVWGLVAAAAFLSIGAVAVAFVLRPQPQAAPPPVNVPPPAAVAPAAEAAEEEAEPEANSEGEKAAGETGEEEEEETTTGSTKKRSKKRATKRSTKSAATTSEKKSDTVDDLLAPKPKSEPAKPSGPRTIDDLLDSALSGKSAKRTTKSAPAPSENLPKQPSKSEVLKAMGGVKGAVSACAKGQNGVAIVNVTVAGSTGRVTNAQVEGITGPAGSCIAKAVRRAKFPKFQQSTFKVKFPFRL
jgi:predicted Zn finger-like uncharacterized protein